jgi:hypothetical protein
MTCTNEQHCIIYKTGRCNKGTLEDNRTCPMLFTQEMVEKQDRLKYGKDNNFASSKEN